jgi:hypothetical protein
MRQTSARPVVRSPERRLAHAHVRKRGSSAADMRALVVKSITVISTDMASALKERTKTARRIESVRRESDRYLAIRKVAHTLPEEAKKVLTLIVDEYQTGNREPVTFFVDDLASNLGITCRDARKAVDVLLYRSLILERRGRIAGKGYAPNLAALGIK